MKNIVVYLLMPALLFVGVYVNAQEQNNRYFPKTTGIIQLVDNEKGIVVIDDTSYKMSLALTVKDVKGRKLNRYALKPRQQVIFKLNNSQKRDYVIEAVRIFGIVEN